MQQTGARRELDVLVIGAGPAGAAAAFRASVAGNTVLAIDRKKRIGDPVQCAEFIPLPMAKYAQGDGVLLQRIEGMKSFLPSGAVEESSFPGLMVDRAQFDRTLAERAVAAGAQVLADTRLAALDSRNSLAQIVHANGECETVAYRVLIAADGPHSPTAQALGLPDLSVVTTRQYTVPLRRAYSDTDIWLSDEFPGGYGWLFPKGPVANLGLGADKRFEANMKAPLERLHASLVAEGLVGDEILYRTGGAIPVGGMREKLAHENVMFIGDAAGLTHPITGAGISAAVVSGERAGQAAAEFLQSGDAAAFADFEEDVRDQFEHTLARAVERRRFLEAHWRTQSAQEDRVMRRGWIAFDEYFAAQ